MSSIPQAASDERGMPPAELEGRAARVPPAAARLPAIGHHPGAACLLAAMDLAEEAILVFIPPRLRIVAANEAACRELSLVRGDISASTLWDVVAITSDKDSPLRGGAGVEHAHPGIEVRFFRVQPRREDAGRRNFELVLRVVPDDPEGMIVGRLRPTGADGRNGSNRAPLDRLDPLTGLPDRSALADRLEKAMADSRGSNGDLLVYFVDLDEFKAVNDTHGHLVGDRVLRVVARRLAACLRPGDFVCRFGGDEFVVVIEKPDHGNDAAQIAERMRASITAPILVDGRRVAVGASIGSARAAGGPAAPEELLHAADRAMYEAKRRRRPAPWRGLRA
jgi:diguanylate cyclase (GGDEF)-like protein